MLYQVYIEGIFNRGVSGLQTPPTVDSLPTQSRQSTSGEMVIKPKTISGLLYHKLRQKYQKTHQAYRTACIFSRPIRATSAGSCSQ